MTEMRDSKKNGVEVYATEVWRQNKPYWQALAQGVNTPKPPATTTTTTAATLPNLQSYVPMIALGAGALLLFMRAGR